MHMNSAFLMIGESIGFINLFITYSTIYNDPFERLPLASLLNILRKGNVQYPKCK